MGAMKNIRFIILLVTLLLSTISFAQQKTACVTLKNGTSITGTIVDLNPTSHITLRVAGFETRIEMDDVAAIKDLPTQGDSSLTTVPMASEEMDEDLPESFLMKVGPYEIEMILVKGGSFMMGFDGRGSVQYRSEPRHPVYLHSYYVNRSGINKDVVNYLKHGKENHSSKEKSYSALGWEDANGIAESLAKITGLPISLISEAQWENMVLGEAMERIDVTKNEQTYCYDYIAPFRTSSEPQVDPVGPSVGSRHVMRILSYGDDIYKRYDTPDIRNIIRITFPAASIRDLQ